ncbi:GumC family protein [Pontixanthobacter aquaemixtae]|uniref:non-specific protein-tyrosine kinase n=1 Tax=Pontixanthobacter aquaemixtae TaxID=1958940 RepID=A0A844ZTR9_9SPHN|nr:polysaccharide biosynthesis tyrosine autokinase [Pontixanthobacter aquaemixtae]MXO91343.1 polysaccharide biosynthesis tyrosine autokinase [Pontixanthobacter aquaemixtae]
MNNTTDPTAVFQNAAAPTAAQSEADAHGGLPLNLERYWVQALSLKFWILGLILLGLLFGLIATLLATEYFRATSRIEISRATENITNAAPLERQNRVDEMQYLETQYQLLASKFLARRVIDAGNLARDEKFLTAFGLDEAGTVSEPVLERVLLGNVTITPVEQSNLVDISFSSPSAEVSSSLANLWAEEFLDANYEKRFGQNIEARDFLEEQIEELRERLSISERELVNYANANEIVVINNTGENGSETASQSLVGAELAALNQALAEATTERIAAQSALNAGVKNEAGQAAAASLRARLAEEQAELAELQSKFGPGYPEIKAKKSEIASLRQALSGEDSVDNEALRAAFRKASLQEQQLQAKLRQAKNTFLGQQGQGIQYGILKREVDTNSQLYDALLQRYKELEAAGAGKNNMTLIEEAAVPGGPYSPSLTRNLFLGLLFGVLASGTLVFLRETLDQTIRDPADINRRLGISALGLIPRVSTDDIVKELEQRSSELSEAYATARTNMSFLTADGAPDSIMITSTRPNEGKSISSVALARSFVQLGKKVLLVDADLRHSGLSDFIGVRHGADRGLSAVLAGQEQLSDVTIEIEEYGFSMVPAGHHPPNPVELLASDRLKELIAKAQDDYDLVIVDSAPVLGLADALEVSRAVEGVVYIIESNGENIRGIGNALSRLKTADARIFGAIVTKLDDRNSSYGYGNGYGYGYGYGTANQ